MLYRYRWIAVMLVSGVILSTGFYYFIQPLQKKINRLQRVEKMWRLRLSAWQTTTSTQLRLPPPKMYQQPEVVMELVMQAKRAGLNIESIQEMGALLLQLRAQGDIGASLRFMQWLSKQQDLILLDYAVHALLPKQLQWQLTVAMLSNVIHLRLSESHTMHSPQSPFCADTAYAQHAPVLFPLSAIKMLGYLRQGSHEQALLALPNNKVIAVERGTSLGQAQGVVENLNPKHVHVRLADGTHLEIKQ